MTDVPDHAASVLSPKIVAHIPNPASTCSDFQSSVPAENRLIAVAGLFNTGTNLMMKLLNHNCVMPKRKTPFQVPWGKHNPVDFRGVHFAKSSKGQIPEHFLPVVIIKDVVTWVNSMCKNPYAAHWQHKYKCPQLVKEDLSPVEVEIKFQEDKWGHRNYENGLVEAWSTWNSDWARASFPYVMVRFEDILYNQEQTVKLACECAGGHLAEVFEYQDDPAKGHGGKEGAMDVLKKYGDETKRFQGWREADLDFLSRVVDQDLMNMFEYRLPPVIENR
ncbi:hypothetical protein TrLO_g11127 [Triparma laevis f. longispina]|uniref:Sulfotransferase domain-containing protein n=1 Tax=Triparma laevis f. longispina TaxID=1714387 RepID=A0A9W7F534_9STRA|nr:hypothetical protein TrLO_g11127 [Triparma laevis f. longispina]